MIRSFPRFCRVCGTRLGFNPAEYYFSGLLLFWRTSHREALLNRERKCRPSVFLSASLRRELASSFWGASALEVAAEGQVQVHAFAQAGSADLRQLDFCGKILSGETQDGEHVDLALFELLPAKF